MDAFALEILCQCDGFVLANVAFVEALAVEIADLYFVIVQDCDRSDPFAHQGWRDVADESASPDAENLAAGEYLLVETRDPPLPILSAGDDLTFQPD